ncbi:MAG: aminoacetone oxidase family FAD-binding enzyme [Peptococcaceae bacterium]|jgi:predicted Rossmann fold flavoprotein|nr:aminoacetone oxidase family FAD-binding enzyme [Peptococcaceae bacterium]
MAAASSDFDVAVIGGGAAGAMAAVGAASRLGPEGRVALLESGQRIGRKLLATGNGRCNYSNRRVTAKDYNRPGFVAGVFRACAPEGIRERFAKSGLEAMEEDDGRLYPMSGSASSVLDVLRLLLEEKSVTVYTDFKIYNITADQPWFRLDSSQGYVRAATAVLATGGKAAPQLGSDGSGLKLAEKLGHTVTKLYPGLTALNCPADLQRELGLKALNGLRVSGRAALYRQDKMVAQEEGEILFREYGLSGVAVFQLSRLPGAGLILLDLMPRVSSPELLDMLADRAERLSGRPLEEFFTGMFQRMVGNQLMKVIRLSVEERDCGGLTTEELEALAGVIKGWPFPVEGAKGWQNAQVTLGGLNVEEFDALTLESRLVPGFFAAGEVLDVDGPCGGYNLQWAWSSGLLAGWSAAKVFRQEMSY